VKNNTPATRKRITQAGINKQLATRDLARYNAARQTPPHFKVTTVRLGRDLDARLTKYQARAESNIGVPVDRSALIRSLLTTALDKLGV
jgi:hypothetical protein